MAGRGFEAIVLDLDEVITKTADQHARSWKIALDEYLKSRQKEQFDVNSDFNLYIDRKPKDTAIREFLSSRDIRMPEGKPEDSPEANTIYGIVNKKNEVFLELINKEGVNTFDDTAHQLKRWKERGLKLAVTSGSKNGRSILENTDLFGIFDLVVDGAVLEEEKLKSKPHPDALQYTCRKLNVAPEKAVLVEDTMEGVMAGKAAQFGLVVGVARNGSKRELIDNGADIVVVNMENIKTIGMKKMMNNEI